MRKRNTRKRVENDFNLLLARLRTKYESLRSAKIPWIILVCADGNPAIIQHVEDSFEKDASIDEIIEIRKKEMEELGKQMSQNVNNCYGIIYVTFFYDQDNHWAVTYIQYSIDEEVRIYTESMENDKNKWCLLKPSGAEKIVNKKGWMDKESGRQPRIVTEVLNKLIRFYKLYSIMNI